MFNEILEEMEADAKAAADEVKEIEMLALKVSMYPVVRGDSCLNINDADTAVTYEDTMDDVYRTMAEVYYWLEADKCTDHYDSEKNWIRIGRKSFDPTQYRLVEFAVSKITVRDADIVSTTQLSELEMDLICENAYEFYLTDFNPYARLDDEDDEDEDDYVYEECGFPVTNASPERNDEED